MAQYINDPVPKYRQEDLNKTTKDLHGYVTGLSDQLQFLLANLDADNIPELPDIMKRLTDAQGNITKLEVTAKGLELTIRDNEGNMSRITADITGIRANISNVEGDISNLRQTASSLSSQISSAKGDISSLRQTASSLSSQISNQGNQISYIRQTASSIESRVSDLNGKYSSLKQTVDGFDFRGMVTFRDLRNELDDYPSNSDLRRGRTTIDGGCITTGKIDCEYIDLYGQLSVYERMGGRGEGGFIGYCSGSSETGIGVMESRRGGQCICTDGGARLTHGRSDNSIWVTRGGCFSSETMQTYSDRRLKQDIKYDLADYEAFYRALKPCSFLMRRHTSGRRHIGFIAQEIEEALQDVGLSGASLAAACFDANAKRQDGTEETGLWSVRYGEFIALNTAMIQGLLHKVDALTERVDQLESLLESTHSP